MDPPPVKFATTSDGYDIAYAVTGNGPMLLFMPWTFDHVQLAWQYPGVGPWLEALISRFTVVQFDPRGSGMSTRGLRSDHAFADYSKDFEAVAEKTGRGPLVLLAGASAATIAVNYALEQPKRVRALIFVGAATEMVAFKAPALWRGVSAQDWDLFLHSLTPNDYNPELARNRVALLKQAYGQHDFVLKMEATARVPDLGPLLSQVRIPALVLHSRDFRLLDIEESIKFARLIGGQIGLIEGTSSFGDPDQAMRAIDLFLEVLPPSASVEEKGQRETLSDRELEVLRLVAAGKSNPQIADELVISLNTVQRHVSNIFAKTGLTNRVEAAGYARDHGIA